ncbi:MAG: hypothetical protein WDN28_29490 [Chthoniobacter sp.]
MLFPRLGFLILALGGLVWAIMGICHWLGWMSLRAQEVAREVAERMTQWDTAWERRRQEEAFARLPTREKFEAQRRLDAVIVQQAEEHGENRRGDPGEGTKRISASPDGPESSGAAG